MFVSKNLIIQGILFISSEHPAYFKQSGGQVWISDPKVINAQALNQGLVLSSKTQEGVAFANGLDTKSGTLKILITSPQNVEALKRCSLNDLNVQDSRLLISISRKQELKKYLVRLKNCGFEGLGLVEPLQTKDSHAQIQAETALTQFPQILEVRSTSSGSKSIVLRSSAKAIQDSIRNALGDFAPLYKFEFQEGAKPGQTLIFDLTLFEFSQSKASSLGLRWPTSIRFAPLESGAQGGAKSASGSSILIGADFGESQGVGRVLARPRIRCLPGEKASFQSGGELPIKQQSLHGQSVQWKSYGLNLNLEPERDIKVTSQELSLLFKLELSDIDRGNSLDGIPALVTRRLESRFALRIGEQSILTTMIQTRKGFLKDGLAGLSRLPIGSSLFSSNDQYTNESELWFALRPTWEGQE